MVSRKEVKPLTNLVDTLAWQPSEGEKFEYPESCSRSSDYLPGATWRQGGRTWSSLVSAPLCQEDRSRVKTVVCHDMMGGYLQDRFIDGDQEDGYYFSHWANIDIFIYFSHHFITIPPVGWISAARRHGVQVSSYIL